jgi:hypothetical protein
MPQFWHIVLPDSLSKPQLVQRWGSGLRSVALEFDMNKLSLAHCSVLKHPLFIVGVATVAAAF